MDREGTGTKTNKGKHKVRTRTGKGQHKGRERKGLRKDKYMERKLIGNKQRPGIYSRKVYGYGQDKENSDKTRTVGKRTRSKDPAGRRTWKGLEGLESVDFYKFLRPSRTGQE